MVLERYGIKWLQEQNEAWKFFCYNQETICYVTGMKDFVLDNILYFLI